MKNLYFVWIQDKKLAEEPTKSPSTDLRQVQEIFAS